MQTTSSPKIDFKQYHHWIAQGKSYSAIREDLSQKGYTDAEISRLIRTIDNEQHAQLHRTATLHNAYLLMAVGAVLFITGAGITVYTYFTGRSVYVIFYGAILSGIGLFLRGWHKKE